MHILDQLGITDAYLKETQPTLANELTHQAKRFGQTPELDNLAMDQILHRIADVTLHANGGISGLMDRIRTETGIQDPTFIIAAVLERALRDVPPQAAEPIRDHFAREPWLLDEKGAVHLEAETESENCALI